MNETIVQRRSRSDDDDNNSTRTDLGWDDAIAYPSHYGSTRTAAAAAAAAIDADDARRSTGRRKDECQYDAHHYRHIMSI